MAHHKQPDSAQRRIERIRAFREELAQLELDRVLALTEEQRRRLGLYHQGILARAAAPVAAPGKSAPPSGKPTVLSLALSAGIPAAAILVLDRLWWFLPPLLGIGLLLVAPVGATLGTQLASRSARAGALVSPFAGTALACLALSLARLCAEFAVVPPLHALLLWGAFALFLAYSHGLRVPLAAGILSLVSYLTCALGAWKGVYWVALATRPEAFLPGGLALLTLSFRLPRSSPPQFQAVFRAVGLVTVFVPVLVLANWGDLSFIPGPADQIQAVYLALGLTGAGLSLVIGLWSRKDWITKLAGAILIVFLCARFSDHWSWVLAGLGVLCSLALLVWTWARTNRAVR